MINEIHLRFLYVYVGYMFVLCGCVYVYKHNKQSSLVLKNSKLLKFERKKKLFFRNCFEIRASLGSYCDEFVV